MIDEPEKDISLHDLWPQKCHILTTIRTVWGPYKKYRKAVKDHNMFTADPVAEIIQTTIEKTLPLIKEAHVRDALDDAVNFANYTGSTDNAYRAIRNYLLESILDNQDKIRKALEEERSTEDYRDPSKWYDNRKVTLRQKREELRSKGLLKDDEFLPEEVPYMDDIQWKMYLRSQEEKNKGR